MDDTSDSVPARPEDEHRFEGLLWDLFLSLMDVPGDRVESEILSAQRRLCLVLGLDRSVLWQASPDDPRSLLLTHVFDRDNDVSDEASADGSVELGPERAFVLVDTPFTRHARSSERFPWLTERALAGLTTVLETLDGLPPEAAVDAEYLRRAGTRSSVVVPLQAQGVTIGAISFAATRDRRPWPPALVSRFELVAQVFAKALARTRTEGQLKAALADLARLKDQLQRDNLALRVDSHARRGSAQVVGTSPAVRRMLALVDQVAPTGATVLLLGETGTGKERVAAAIHELSQRRTRPMVKVNCAAMPDALIESELFGREKGAYTGALTKQIGRFELAHESTIFLDEIGDLSAETQTKLLRVIESREFERLGSPRPVQVDVRIIAATHRDLEQAVREGRFREDLFFRLNVFPIRLPALRERPEDVPLLVKALVDELSMSMGRHFDTIDATRLSALQQYPWPGNIRELRNVVERAMITSEGPVLHIDLPPSSGRRAVAVPPSLKAVERDHVVAVLERTGWRIRGPRGAAAILGLPPTTLEHRMSKLGIIRPWRTPRA